MSILHMEQRFTLIMKRYTLKIRIVNLVKHTDRLKYVFQATLPGFMSLQQEVVLPNGAEKLSAYEYDFIFSLRSTSKKPRCPLRPLYSNSVSTVTATVFNFLIFVYIGI